MGGPTSPAACAPGGRLWRGGRGAAWESPGRTCWGARRSWSCGCSGSPAVPAAQRRVGVPPVPRRTRGQPWLRAARAAHSGLPPRSRSASELRRPARNARSFKPLEGSEPLDVCAVGLRAALETSRRSPRSRLPFGKHVQADLEPGSPGSDVSGLGAERLHRNAAPDGRGDGGALP